MTLLFMDGFDHYDTQAQLAGKWEIAASVAGIGSTYSRWSDAGEGIYITSSNANLTKVLGLGTKTTLYVGIAFYFNSENCYYSASYPMLRFLDESSVTQVRIHGIEGFGFAAYNASTLLGESSIGVWQSHRWHYLEVKLTISDTVGEVVVRIDESTVLNLTSKDTKNGSAYVDQVRIAAPYSGFNTMFDDFYIDDAGFLGNCRVKTFMPDSDGNSSDFTRSTGSNDYECVDEQGSNEDTDYIYSETLNHKSIFGITTGALGTVKGIQLNNHCRIDQAGTRKVTPIIRSNSTDYSGTEGAALSAGYMYEHEIFETDPDDSNPWTQTKLEAAEFGLEITT